MPIHNTSALLPRGFILLLGLCILLPVGTKLWRYTRFYLNSEETRGVVTTAFKSRIAGTRPFVAFKDSTGHVHEFQTKILFHWAFTPKLGDEIPVRYHLKDPSRAVIDSPFFNLVMPLCFFLVGLLMVYLAIFHAMTGKRTAEP
tara:strand:+ start:298 stop:729 length:432 start_codon:yes stop_codon:yes gene_type:complete